MDKWKQRKVDYSRPGRISMRGNDRGTSTLSESLIVAPDFAVIEFAPHQRGRDEPSIAVSSEPKPYEHCGGEG